MGKDGKQGKQNEKWVALATCLWDPQRAVHLTQKVKEDSARHRGALKQKPGSFQVWKKFGASRGAKLLWQSMEKKKHQKTYDKVSEVLPLEIHLSSPAKLG